MQVAAPWNLSHYIPLDGFHPRYRALFDHAPVDIEPKAWDNVKLQTYFAGSLQNREAISSLAGANRLYNDGISNVVARNHADHFWPPDKALTEALPGDLEFHHTSPFPSLQRPFIFHCESFPPVFFPDARQGFLDKPVENRIYYQRLFSSPLCQGIYSHIPETLDGFRHLFRDPAIDDKLIVSKIGLSKRAVDPGMFGPRPTLDNLGFVFINSADQLLSSFFNRGGHVVLRFWKEFQQTGRKGKLVLRSRRPDDATLARHGVDPVFVRNELGRSILWLEGYLSDHELNAIIANSHFLLLPSASLHSSSILRAMTLGTVPIVTDTVGTSLYVTDRETGIVLKGVRDEIWHRDPDTDALLPLYKRMPNVEASLVDQLSERILEIMNAESAHELLRKSSAERAQSHFSGEVFASEFWSSVIERAAASQTQTGSSASALSSSNIADCTLDMAGWSRVFESSTQPMPLLDTGRSMVFKLGGAVVHVAGDARPNEKDWSVLARYFNPYAVESVYANDLVDLGNLFIPLGEPGVKASSVNFRQTLSLALMRFPALHSLASGQYRRVKRSIDFVRLWYRHKRCLMQASSNHADGELVVEEIHHFNIVRCFHKFYAIPCGEGPFIISRAEKRLYSRTFSAYSLEAVIDKINRNRVNRRRFIAALPVISSVIDVVGEQRVRAVLKLFRRRRNRAGK